MSDELTRNVITDRWSTLLDSCRRDKHPSFTRLGPLIEALAAHPQISKLYPFTSHEFLHLAENTQYPYMTAGIYAIAIDAGLYRVFGPQYTVRLKTYKEIWYHDAEHEILGEGNVSQAVDLIARNLPEDIEPAIIGTEDDVRRHRGQYVMSPSAHALHIAALRGKVDEMAVLLDEGTAIDALDYAGRTPLLSSAMSRKIDGVRFLVERGARVETIDHFGSSAVDIARELKSPDIAEYLLTSGAPENRKITVVTGHNIDPPWAEMLPIIAGIAPESLPTPDRFVCVKMNGEPWKRIEVYGDGSSAFFEAISWRGLIVIGDGTAVHFVDPYAASSHFHPLDCYFGHLYDAGDRCLVASGHSLYCFDSTRTPLWQSDWLGIDGVVVHGIEDGVVHGEGEWDPPGGWRRFRVDLLTGETLT